ncbi:MAG: zinc ABC transporter substrate-binding protein [Verrucomicrobiales bacterium]|nr:zinc ABC transporter substrate-binding protein [Verrucomicrobiales bacterium]
MHPLPTHWAAKPCVSPRGSRADRHTDRRSLGVLIHPARVLAVLLYLSFATVTAVGAEPKILRVCASTTDLASLASEVGGRRVEIFCFGSGPEDPHELELKPSFTRQLDAADLYLQVGLGIENAWLGRLMATVRNESVKPGGPGNLNIGQGVTPLEGESARGKVGSYHEEGNPHYLLDPLEGLKAASAIRDRLARLRPAWKGEFEANYERFRLRLGSLLVGEECAKQDDVLVLVATFERLKPGPELDQFLTAHKLGGWLGTMARFRGRAVVGDHDLWPYFARRTGLTVAGYLEPDPGVPPTTKHLQALVVRMKQEKAHHILTAPYFDQRHVGFVAEKSGARILPMAHQAGARPGTSTYLEMLTLNFGQLIEAFTSAP